MTLPRIFCPECSTKLKSPSGFTVGETVCCPKCETYFTVEAPKGEEVEPEAPADQDEKPRKKKKKKRADETERSYSNSPLRYAILGTLVVTMLVLAFFLYKKTMREREENAREAEPDAPRVGQLTPPVQPGTQPRPPQAKFQPKEGSGSPGIDSIRSCGGMVTERDGRVIEISFKSARGLSDSTVVTLMRGANTNGKALWDSLRAVDLSGNPITDDCIMNIRPLLISVEELRLDNTKVTDKGLAMLVEWTTKLKVLSLVGDAGVTDDGIPPVSSLRQLKEVNLSGTRVTPEAIKELQRVLPGLVVARDGVK